MDRTRTEWFINRKGDNSYGQNPGRSGLSTGRVTIPMDRTRTEWFINRKGDNSCSAKTYASEEQETGRNPIRCTSLCTHK